MELSPNFSDKAKRDYDLIQLAKKGNQIAFAELMGYYRESLYYLLLKMVNSKEDAEDLTIETFEKAFRKIGSYKPVYAFSTWLFRIATNHGIDFLRTSEKRMNDVYIESDISYDDDFYNKVVIAEDSLNPEEKIVSIQKKNILKNIIQKLPPDYRRIIVLRYFEEYSYSEISEKLDLPLGTVKARLYRSRELLLSTLKKHNIHDEKF
ncbi:MAG: sigma-70 family RNA polymerase sigma factor [Bacteroidales bacterium]|nr:sigma-70 family RNA polymerase sigma factor [Bacteroidales bacterium]